MITDFLDGLIVKTAHFIGACVFGVMRLYVYAQFVALLLIVTGLLGFGLYLAGAAVLKSTIGH